MLLLLPIIGWSQSYVGTVGDYPIHMEFIMYPNENDSTSGELEGIYFYDSKLISIPISGDFKKDKITLIDGYYFRPEKVIDAEEVFELTKKGNQLFGTLRIKDDEFIVVLAETEESPLEDFRNPKLKFVKDSIINYKGKELVWFHEKYSKVPLFRLGNGFTSDQRAKINPVLDDMHLAEAHVKLDCSSWYKIIYTINLVSDNFISYFKYYNVFCGGAHPSHGNVGYNFNLETLEVVEDVESLYPEVDFFQLLKDKYYDKNDEHQEECGVFDDPSSWSYKNWNLTETGIILIPSYPHAMSPCEEEHFLSYDELKR